MWEHTILRLYVGSLSYQTTEQELADLFGQVGQVISATVITWAYALVFYATAPTIVAPPLSMMVLSAILNIVLTLLFGAGIGAIRGGDRGGYRDRGY